MGSYLHQFMEAKMKDALKSKEKEPIKKSTSEKSQFKPQGLHPTETAEWFEKLSKEEQKEYLEQMVCR